MKRRKPRKPNPLDRLRASSRTTVPAGIDLSRPLPSITRLPTGVQDGDCRQWLMLATAPELVEEARQEQPDKPPPPDDPTVFDPEAYWARMGDRLSEMAATFQKPKQGAKQQ